MQPQTSDTSCKECIFAEWDKDTQTGCSAGDKLQEYRDKNIPVIECYDEEKEFYVIPNRQCMYRRTKGWDYKDKDWNTQKERMDEEILLRFQAIVVADITSDPEPLFNTLDSLYSQELKPSHIAVVRTSQCRLNPDDIVDYLLYGGIRWKIENVVDLDYPVEKYEDLIVDFVKDTHMYSRFNAGTIIPPNFFSTLNHKVHEEMFYFAALMPNSEGSGWTIPRSIYTYFMGNKQLTLLTKLEGYECPMYPVTEVVPSFPK